MEYRSEQRVSGTNLPVATQVRLTILGDGTGEETTLKASVGNLSGRGVRLLLDRPLALDTAVRVDFQHDEDGALLLGEVVYCVQEGNHFAIGLELHHSLVHLTSLHELMSRLMGEQTPSVESEPSLRGMPLEINRRQ